MFSVFGKSRPFPGARSSLRTVAGLENVRDAFFGGDVENELVPEFDENPGQQRVRFFSVLQRSFFLCMVRCGF